LLAGFLVARFAPEAAGSGIPQVKAALAYMPIPLNARVAGVKLLGTLLSLGAGLSLGRQGPTVQIGAAIAAQLSRWFPTTPDHRRQLLAAGAAAGLAAGFNAPIAGVLFVIEELLQDVSGLTLGTAILASFIGAVVSRLLGGGTLQITPGLMDLNMRFSPAMIPLLILLGIVAGALGVLFIRGAVASLRFNRRLHLGLPWRIGLAGVISGTVLALLPSVLHDNDSLQEVWITRELTWQMLALMFVVKFGLTLVAMGSGAPGGLFAPSLILGSALGYFISYGAQSLQTTIGIPLGVDLAAGEAVTFALAGMGAFFSAVTRGPITAIVIVFEMTTEFSLVLPLMITSVTAYLVGEAISSGSIYKYILAFSGIVLSPQNHQLEARLAGLTAADIMQSRVETLSSQMPLHEVLQAFARSHHRGFPVVDEGKLVGIVTQTDLAKIDQQQLSDQLPLSLIMTTQPIRVRVQDPLSQVLYWLNRYQVSRLPVVDRHQLVGIITRADIIRAESDRLSGETQPGPQPEPSYVVYQTRDPAVGQGRVLVTIANPNTAMPLLQVAAAIAKAQRHELECLQVILVSRLRSPAETDVSTTASRKLLKLTNKLRNQWNIPIHTQIRVSHDISHAILETLKERRIDLLLMGWNGVTDTPGRVFGNVVDTMIRQATCDVVLIKFATGTIAASETRFDRWLLPMAGGPNSRHALRLLPALMKLADQPQVRLCYVSSPQDTETQVMLLEETAATLRNRVSATVEATALCSLSVPDAVTDLAEKDQCDVIVLGATREGMLQQVIKGNIPEAIARRCDCTVILVRGRLD
jgi:chloride channel protein, CIC family